MRDGVRRPRVHARGIEHSGGTGAPPGPTKRSCQELAVRFVFAPSAFAKLAPAGEGRPGARIELKRGPQPEDAANDMRFGVRGSLRYALKQREARVAHENERVWRAERRPPCLPKGGADTIGLRLSARHPPPGDSLFDMTSRDVAARR